jgi:hypothetical protein
MPQPPNFNGKDLGRYQDLGRGPLTSYYRRLAAKAGHAPGAGILQRLGAFTSSVSNYGKWASHVMRYAASPLHPFQKYPPGGGIYPVNDKLSLSIAGDWGTGTDEALQVTTKMKEHGPDYTIHLGDVYYVGDLPELEVNCLGLSSPKHTGVKWETGTLGSFALNGNHEMYACGDAYFNDLLPRLGPNCTGQGASFFCLRNKNWRIVGLDTGYDSVGLRTVFNALSRIKAIKWFRKTSALKPRCELRPEILDWLKDVMQPNPDGTQPATVLLSHHQYFSGFDDWYPIPGQQLRTFIKDQPVLWFWGHEHRFAVYDKFRVGDGIEAYGRCVGNGGMPVDRGHPPDIKDCRCLFYDDRPYPNNEGIDVGYNGFITLNFAGPHLVVNYYDLYDKLLLTEEWCANTEGVLSGPSFSNICPDLTASKQI